MKPWLKSIFGKVAPVFSVLSFRVQSPKRFHVGLLLAGLSTLLFFEGSQAYAQTTAVPANDFLNSLGVNTHVDLAHAGNGHAESVYEPMFEYTGIRLDRDNADYSTTAAALVTMHNNTVQTGAGLPQIPNGVMMDIGSFNITAQKTSATTLAAAGALLSLEGPNEPNNFMLTYNGIKGGGNSLTTALTGNGANTTVTGLSLNTTTGVISGTPVSPAAAGTYAIALSATNASGTSYATLTIMLNASSALPVINSAATLATTNSPITPYTITASNSPTSFTATGLPTGLTLNTSTGVISGTPTPTSGIWPVLVTATNASGTSEAILTVTINATAGIPVINSSAAVSATINSAFTYSITPTGATSYAASASWLPDALDQRDLYSWTQANLPGYPVFSVSYGGGETTNLGLQFLTIPTGSGLLMPDGTQYADYGNLHNYICSTGSASLGNNWPWQAADPTLNSQWNATYVNYGHTWLHGYSGYSNTVLPTVPRVTTETGWQTTGTHSISEDQQGKLFLEVYLAQFKRGISSTFLYEIMDQEGGFSNTYGIYHSDSTPKDAATYIHNFTTILADDSSIPTPGTLNYTIPNEPSTVHDLLLQKSNGLFELVVWDEKTGGKRHRHRQGEPRRDLRHGEYL